MFLQTLFALAALLHLGATTPVAPTTPVGQLPLNPNGNLPAQGPYEVFVNVNSLGVRGYIIMQQQAIGSPVSITASLWYDQSVVAPVATNGHQWRIHTNKIIKPYECNTAKGMFDPAGISNSAAYLCTPQNQANCAPGDLGGKFGPLAVGVIGAPANVDVALQDNTFNIPDVYGGSVVIYKPGSVDLNDYMACGVINVPKVATATFDGSMGVVGTIQFTQQLDGAVSIVTTLTDMNRPATTSHPMHIHKKTPTKLNDDCKSAGGHYDPFEKELGPDGKINVDYYCDPASPLECYAGDITGKAGNIDLPAAGVTIIDPNLDLDDILGRSVVVHVANDGKTRLACASIVTETFATDEMKVYLGAGCVGALFLTFVIVQFVAE